jgi:hypothetical protein
MPHKWVFYNMFEFICSFADTVTIAAIYNIYQGICVVEVVSPKGAKLFLTADVPDCEDDIFVLDFFYIEADGGDGGEDLSYVEFVEDGGLAGCIQTCVNS